MTFKLCQVEVSCFGKTWRANLNFGSRNWLMYENNVMVCAKPVSLDSHDSLIFVCVKRNAFDVDRLLRLQTCSATVKEKHIVVVNLVWGT